MTMLHGQGSPTRATTVEVQFRPDVEGLRGIAVGLVVLFHAGLLGVSGGFIGVDVFFVISGFLITGLLLREVEREGRISFRDFYARRIRRLAPAAIVVLVVTAVLTMLIASPLDTPEFLLDGSAAALSFANFRFAAAASDYFTAVAAPSPFLHYWSLAVEEQFYLLWPALIAVTIGIVGTRNRRASIGVILLVILGLSFAINSVVTAVAVNWAFYSLPTRAWELAAGGLLAVWSTDLARLPARLRAVAGVLGMIVIVVAAIRLDSTVPYPGSAALWPTIGSLGVLLAAGQGPVRIIELAPIRFIGRISYSLYLWHWPLLVLPVVAGLNPPTLARVALVCVAIVAATLSWRFVETPFRAGARDRRRRSPGRVVGVGLACLVALGLAMTGLSVASTPSAASNLPAASATPDVRLLPGASQSLRPTSLATPDGSSGASPGPTDYSLPPDIRPSPAGARADTTEARLRADGCMGMDDTIVPPPCVYGDPNGSFTVALVGDSHAAQWFTALDAIASARHWRLVTFTKVRCPFMDVPMQNIKLKREYTECEAWNRAVVDRLTVAPADLVVISLDRNWIAPVDPALANPAAEGASEARLVARLPGRVALIVDTPFADKDVPACLAANTSDIRPCAFSRAFAEGNAIGVREAAVALATGAGLIDLNDEICSGDPCWPIVNGMLIFRDHSHLTATFSRALAPGLAAAIDRVLGN